MSVKPTPTPIVLFGSKKQITSGNAQQLRAANNAYNIKLGAKWGVQTTVSWATGNIVPVAALNAKINQNWASTYVKKDSGTGGGGGGGNQTPVTAQLNYNPKELIYNVGCVKDAYFRNANGFFQEMSTSKLGTVTDRPSAITNPNQLWQNSGTNKGMITLFVPESSDPNVDGAVVPEAGSKLQPAEHRRYGFQFHYNPTTIKMDYAGAPNTDVGLEISGREHFNLVGAQVNQSTIAFDIVINRVFDMNYFDATGSLKPEARRTNNPLYSPRMPENAAEEKQIFNKGTMYDIEFLLSTVIGYRLNTKFRGITADVGWLSGRPVELYLGKSLRYVGFINAFNIQHQMFNERMVPIFTVASLNFNRIPDYAGM